MRRLGLHMNDANAEYLVLLEVATREAERFLSGRTLDRAPEELAQEAVVEFWQWRKKHPDEKVEYPAALVKRMTRNRCLDAVKKDRRRKRLDEQKPPPPERRSPAEEQEDIEEARALLLRLQVQNEIQREIIAHALRGLDIHQDREDVLWCMCVTSKELTRETFNLKGLKSGDTPMELCPTCDCAVVRDYLQEFDDIPWEMVEQAIAAVAGKSRGSPEWIELNEFLQAAQKAFSNVIGILCRRTEMPPEFDDWMLAIPPRLVPLPTPEEIVRKSGLITKTISTAQ